MEKELNRMSADELGHVIAKTLRHFADVDQQELPPLVYQLLLLSTKVTNCIDNVIY